MKKILLVMLGVVLGILVSTAQISLSFNPKQGVSYQYTMDMTQKIKQNVMGQNIDMDQKMVMSYSMVATKKTQNEMHVSFVYDRIVYELVNPMMQMKFDSQNAENLTGMDAMIGKIFGSMIGKKFNAVLLPDGTVKSVTGMDAVIDDMMKSIGNDMMAQQMSEQMKGQFSNEAIRKSFEQSFNMYPASPVKVGDTWNMNHSAEASGMAMDIKSTYTLKSADSRKAVIAVTSDIKTPDGSITGTQAGELTLDTATGLPEKSSMTQDIKGTVSAQGMEVGMGIHSVISVSTKEK